MNIQVSKLSRKTTEGELRKLFSQYGKVSTCTIIIDEVTKKSKGFGFVEMENKDEATLAVNSLNKKKFEGERIRVKTTKSKG